MVSEPRKQSMALMEHGLQILLKRYELSIEDKMAAGAFGCATNYGWNAISYPEPANSLRRMLDENEGLWK